MAHPYDEFADVPFSRFAAAGKKIGGREVFERLLRDETKVVLEDSEAAFLKTFSSELGLFTPQQESSQPLTARYIVPIPNVPVNYDRSFVDAAKAGGPNTTADYDVLKVGDLYVARHKGIVRRNITIVNFTQNVSSEQALEFGLKHNLGRTIDPWECFATNERRPKLNRELGFDYMAVLSLEHCSFLDRRQVPSVWWDGGGCRARLLWFDSPWLDGFFWFGFVSES